jgi:hypothetical protein
MITAASKYTVIDAIDHKGGRNTAAPWWPRRCGRQRPLVPVPIKRPHVSCGDQRPDPAHYKRQPAHSTITGTAPVRSRSAYAVQPAQAVVGHRWKHHDRHRTARSTSMGACSRSVGVFFVQRRITGLSAMPHLGHYRVVLLISGWLGRNRTGAVSWYRLSWRSFSAGVVSGLCNKFGQALMLQK